MRNKLAEIRSLASRAVCKDGVLAAAMAVLVAYYCIIPGVFQGKHSGDGFFAFAYLRGIVFDHTIDMSPVLPEWQRFFAVDAITHHMPNRNPIGPVFAWMPFYLVACVVGFIGRLFHHPVGPSSPFHAWMAGLGTLALVLVGWRQLYVLIERNFGRGAARLGSIAAVWATPIAWYTAEQPLYQHGAAFGMVAILVERWDLWRRDPTTRRWFLLGLIAGAAAMMRVQEALFALLPGVDALVGVVRGPRRAWLLRGLAVTGGFVLAFLPQLLVWRYYTGSAIHAPQIEPLRWREPFLLVTLFSTKAGLFPWSPIIYASVIGVFIGRGRQHLRAPLVVIFVVNIYIVACAYVLSGGYGFGARRLSDGAVLFAIGVALFWDRLRRRSALVAYVGLCVVMCVAAMELQRIGWARSSGGKARTTAMYLAEVRAPSWLAKPFDHVGFPFVQPAGWIWAMVYDAPVKSFEAVVGAFQLDRDGQWFVLSNEGQSLPLDLDHAEHVMSGLKLNTPGKPAVVTGPVRLIVYMFAKEKVGVTVRGIFPPGAVAVDWAGVTVPVTRDPDSSPHFEIPAASARAGTVEVRMSFPAGSLARTLEFRSYSAPR